MLFSPGVMYSMHKRQSIRLRAVAVLKNRCPANWLEMWQLGRWAVLEFKDPEVPRSSKCFFQLFNKSNHVSLAAIC